MIAVAHLNARKPASARGPSLTPKSGDVSAHLCRSVEVRVYVRI